MKRKPKLSSGTGETELPLLLIGWGREGAKEVTLVRNAFPCDKGIDCVNAQTATPVEVLREISRWLLNNSNAQILYIGAHGDEYGISATAKPKAQITWKDLSRTLLSAKRPISVWLGACVSKFAAEKWSGDPLIPVNSIIGFREDTSSSEVTDFLLELTKRSNILHAGRTVVPKDLSFADEDIEELKKLFPSIAIYHKAPSRGYVEVSEHMQVPGETLSTYFGSKCNEQDLNQLYIDVMTGPAFADKTMIEPEISDPPCDTIQVRVLSRKRGKKH